MGKKVKFLGDPISSSPTILPLAAPSCVSCVFFGIVSIVLLDLFWHCLFLCSVQMMRSEEVFAELGGGGLGFNFFCSRAIAVYIYRQTGIGIQKAFRVVCKICFGKPNHPAQTNS